MILIVMKKGAVQHTYVNGISEFEIPYDVDDELLKKVNDRVKFLQSQEAPGLLVASTMVEGGWHATFRSFTFDEDRVRNFFDAYEDNLQRNRIKRPQDYFGDVHTTIMRMREAILKGSYNKDSESFKETCKQLKIKHTYKAIEAYLRGE